MSKTCQQKKSIYTPNSTATAFLEAKAQSYLRPLEDKLLEQIDKRLVGTFSTLFKSILLFRNTKMGLLLSELGEFIAGHEHAPAGTKRISNLLRCKKWVACLFDEIFFANAQRRINQLRAVGKRREHKKVWGILSSATRLNDPIISVFSQK